VNSHQIKELAMSAPKGPAPQPTVLRLLRGNPGKRRLPKNEPLPALDETVPNPPPHVVGYAEDEWWRVAPELYRLGLLTMVDHSVLAAYCMAYGRWCEAEEVIASIKANNPGSKGFLIQRNGQAVDNPVIKQSRLAAEAMVRFAGEFGFSPAARARIAMGLNAPQAPGKFDGLLAG
jgi:P27 family predicted phage terminase small subunit